MNQQNQLVEIIPQPNTTQPPPSKTQQLVSKYVLPSKTKLIKKQFKQKIQLPEGQQVKSNESQKPSNQVMQQQSSSNPLGFVQIQTVDHSQFTFNIQIYQNSPRLVSFQQLTKQQKKLLFFSPYTYSASSPFIVLQKTVQSKVQRKLQSIVQLFFTVTHPSFTQYTEQLIKYIQQCIKVASQQFIIFTFTGRLKKSFQALRKKLTVVNQPIVVQTVPAQGFSHCVKCQQKCKSKGLKVINKNQYYDKSQYCSQHSQLILYKLKIIYALLLSKLQLSAIKDKALKTHGFTTHAYVVLQKINKLFSTYSSFPINKAITTSQKSDLCFYNALRLAAMIDAQMLVSVNTLTYNCNSQVKLTRLNFQLSTNTQGMPDFLVRQYFHFQHASSRFTNSPKEMNQKAKNQKPSVFYGGELPILLIQFLMQGIFLKGMTKKPAKDTTIVEMENDFLSGLI